MLTVDFIDKESIEDLINNNKQFIKDIIKAINHECNLKKTIKQNKKWKKDYQKQGYKLMSRENIYLYNPYIINIHIKNIFKWIYLN